MDHSVADKTDTVQKEIDLTNYPIILNEAPATSEANIAALDDVKVKVEIELKEEENGLIYQPDFYGHLRLVSTNQTSAVEDTVIKSVKDWSCIQHPLSSAEISKCSIDNNEENVTGCTYEQLNNAYVAQTRAEESSFSNFHNSLFSTSNVYDFKSQQNSFETSQDKDRRRRNRYLRNKEISHILAEKKRNYRNKIKEENPSMWCAMKQKEACKKREQREEKRFILLEMQRMLQLISLPESPDTENYRLYLEELKEKHPDIWRQLIEALSAAEQRNNELLDGTNPTKRLPKPIVMYKDVVEAQKKYLYRQRMKQERPELYEQQKARASYARSVRRMLQKKLSESLNHPNACNNLTDSLNNPDSCSNLTQPLSNSNSCNNLPEALNNPNSCSNLSESLNNPNTCNNSNSSQ